MDTEAQVIRAFRSPAAFNGPPKALVEKRLLGPRVVEVRPRYRCNRRNGRSATPPLVISKAVTSQRARRVCYPGLSSTSCALASMARCRSIASLARVSRSTATARPLIRRKLREALLEAVLVVRAVDEHA